MATKTLAKTSISVVLAILLVIILCESRLFKFFIDTCLGRILLISILLIATCLNKILGLVCVFIIVIMFNNNNSNYEGFDDNTSKTKIDTKEEKSVSTTSDPVSSSNETTTTNKITSHLTTPTVVPNDKINVVTDSSNKNDTKNSTTNNSNSSIEGFDLQSTENTIKRGKQSNSIPVNQYYKQSTEVAPYEGSSFSNFFGFFDNMY